MRIVVTGCRGFVGTHWTRKLEQLGYEVVALDLRTGVDLNDWDRVERIGPLEVMVPLAARTFVPASYERPREFYHTNTLATLNALELCRLHRAKMIFASSYVYGEPRYLPIDEAHPAVAFNPYAQSKLIGETLCRAYNRDFGVPVIIFRPFNIYGMGQHKSFLIPSILSQVQKGEVRLKDPRPKRDLLHIDDLVAAYCKAVAYDRTSFEIFNIASGESYSVAEIVAMITEALNPNARVIFTGEKRKNEVLDTKADIRKAGEGLNWRPVVGFSEGVKGLLEGMRFKDKRRLTRAA